LFLGNWSPDKENGRKDKQRLKSKYGITLEQFENLLKSQGGVCRIFKNKCSVYAYLSVDHDHKTGQVRGLLCRSCNLVLGFAREEPEILEAAITYLKYWKQ